MSTNTVTVHATLSGPLFDVNTPDRALVRGMVRAVEFPREQVRANLSGGIVKPGPGRYGGHLAEHIAAEVATDGSRVRGRVYPEGRGAFRAIMLERGTRQHYIPRYWSTRSRRRKPHVLHFGGVFRRVVVHRGSRGFGVFQKALEVTAPRIAQELGARLVQELRGA